MSGDSCELCSEGKVEDFEGARKGETRCKVCGQLHGDDGDSWARMVLTEEQARLLLDAMGRKDLQVRK